MKSKKMAATLIGLTFIVGVCIGGYFLYNHGMPAPIPMKEELYQGVMYHRVVQLIPRPMIAHVLIIDTKTKGIEFLVTPPDSEEENPLKARTTSQFLAEFDLQIAINGGGFSPWWSRSPADYYPHVGDPIVPAGFTASNGDMYWMGEDTAKEEPTLYISRKNALSFNNRPNKPYNAISGDRMLVLKGELAPDLDDEQVHPRTAIGINRNGRYVYIVVVDGRQLLYSAGATFAELAQLLIEQDAFVGMSLDGGGSSTLVIEGSDGKPRLLNSPIDSYIPGRERPVGTHLGIYIR